MGTAIRHIYFRTGHVESVEYETGEFGIVRDGLPLTQQRWTSGNLHIAIEEFRRYAAEEPQPIKPSHLRIR